MVYPIDSLQTISSGAAAPMSRVRDMYTQSTSTINFTGFGSKITYFDASYTGYTVWSYVFIQPTNTYSLSSWRGAAAGAWSTYTIGSSTLTTGETGLPFNNPQSGENIYGVSNYGFGGGGMSFGVLSAPNGVINPGNIYNRIRQIIFRPYDNKVYFRISDWLSSTTPTNTFLGNGVYHYPSIYGTGYGYGASSVSLISGISDLGADNTFEPTRIASATAPAYNTSGTAAIMLNV